MFTGSARDLCVSYMSTGRARELRMSTRRSRRATYLPEEQESYVSFGRENPEELHIYLKSKRTTYQPNEKVQKSYLLTEGAEELLVE